MICFPSIRNRNISNLAKKIITYPRVLEVEKLTPTADLDLNLTPSFLAPTGAQIKRIPVVCGFIHSKVVMRVLLYATWGSKR